MIQTLQLESFLRTAPPPPPPQPGFDAADMAMARAAGRAEGLAEGRDDAARMMAEAVERLSEQLAAEDRRRLAATRHLDAQLAEVARAIVVALAPPLRAERLTAQVCAALAAEVEAGTPLPPRLRCEPDAAPLLRAALDAGGFAQIMIDIGGFGAEFGVPDGLVRLDPNRVQAALLAIVAEIGAADMPAGTTADSSDQNPPTTDITEDTADE